MKQIRFLLPVICAFSLTSYGATNEQAMADVALLQANAVGDEVYSEREMYRIIPNGVVTLGGESQGVASTRVTSRSAWSASLGRFQLDMSARANTRATSSAMPTEKFQLAFNSRTGRPAVVTGQIITKLQEGVDPENIAADFGLTLTGNFPHINAAIYQVGYPDALNSQIGLLKADGRIVNAYAEIIENQPAAR
jgi:hypothetical protein